MLPELHAELRIKLGVLSLKCNLHVTYNFWLFTVYAILHFLFNFWSVVEFRNHIEKTKQKQTNKKRKQNYDNNKTKHLWCILSCQLILTLWLPWTHGGFIAHHNFFLYSKLCEIDLQYVKNTHFFMCCKCLWNCHLWNKTNKQQTNKKQNKTKLPLISSCFNLLYLNHLREPRFWSQ